MTNFWKLHYFFFFLWLLAYAAPLRALQREYITEYWFGLFLTHRINNSWSVWHDYHYTTNAFYLGRYGLTYLLPKETALTAGYAYVTTSTPFSTSIIRPEHRPWAQIEQRFAVAPLVTFRTRFRYDARFRKAISDAEVLDNRVFNHRLRFMNSLRFFLSKQPGKPHWHFNVMHEMLLFADGPFSHVTTDQNRFYLMPGVTYKKKHTDRWLSHESFACGARQAGNQPGSLCVLAQ
jgi:hypothetical protein